MLTEQSFPVVGMSCATCVAHVQKALARSKGVEQVSVNLATATARVSYDQSVVTLEDLQKAVAAAGYKLIVSTDASDSRKAAAAVKQKAYRILRRRTFVALILTIPVVLYGMIWMHRPEAPWVMWLFATPVVFVMGRDFFRNAWQQLMHRSCNMDTLVALSTGIAYLYSLFNLFAPYFRWTHSVGQPIYFESAAVIITFILLGRLLEERAKHRTSMAIDQLMGLQPSRVVRVNEDGSLEEVAINVLRKGDILLAKPGERIAVDGTVTEGSSYVEESMLTGEPEAKLKQVEAKLFAGTINRTNTLTYRADEVGEETLLAGIIRLVEQAQGSKAPIQRTVDKIASVFVPVILSIAVVTLLLWLLLDADQRVVHGLQACVSVLVIACPCALGLATPTAIMVGVGVGAKHGILIKDAESLEVARGIDTLLVDKTGTLTHGQPQVTDFHSLPQTDMSVFAAMEARSEHPLAAAVAAYLSTDHLPELTNLQTHPGKGVSAYSGVHRYLIGNEALFKEFEIPIPDLFRPEVERLLAEGRTIVLFAQERTMVAVAGIADSIKESSREAVDALQRKGIEVCMLTGDNRAAAERVAAAVGIEGYYSEVLPHEKAAIVKALQAKGKKVAMVGDGINDTAALAQADLSIAMGCGSDIAMEVAGITIIGDDLRRIAEAIRLSHLTVTTIRQNLFWAFFYNLLAVPIAAGVLYPINGFLLNPMIAGAAMALSSVSVVTNSLRLGRRKLSTPTSSSRRVKLSKQIQIKDMNEKIYRIEGMTCMHCRKHVEDALNSLEGVQAFVSLYPPLATIRFLGKEIPLETLQKAIKERAGEDYRIYPN